MNSLFRYIFLFVVVLNWGDEDANAQVNSLRPRTAPAAKFRVNTSRNPKLEAAHEKFIGQQLNLSDSESAKFWPVYRKYQQELTAVRILKRLNNSSAQANGTEQIDKEIEYDNQMVNIRKHYRDEFLKILPAEKVSELYKSERQFTDELFKQLSERSIRAGN